MAPTVPLILPIVRFWPLMMLLQLVLVLALEQQRRTDHDSTSSSIRAMSTTFVNPMKQASSTVVSYNQQPGLFSLAISQNCSYGSSEVSFEVHTILNLTGIPSLISEAVVTALETSFVVAYNDLITCPLLGTSRTLHNATIVYTGITTGFSVQSMTFLVIARGRDCTFCASNASIHLFSNVSSSGFQSRIRQRELRQMTEREHATTSKVSADLWRKPTTGSRVVDNGQNRRAAVRNVRLEKGEKEKAQASEAQSAMSSYFRNSTAVSHQNSASPSDLKRALQNTGGCTCRGPSQSAFTTLLSALLLNSSALNSSSTNTSGGGGLTAIYGVAGATQLLPVSGCNPSNQSDFNTTAVLRIAAAAAQSLSSTDLQIIGDQIKQSYTAVNNLNSQVCDPYFRQIVQVQYQANRRRRRLANVVTNTTQGGAYNVSYNASNGTNTTTGGNATTSYSSGTIVDLIFLLSGTCIGCPTNAPLFNYVSSRRQLQQGSPFTSQTTADTTCLCPQGAKITLPSVQEFTQVLNASLIQSFSSQIFVLDVMQHNSHD